MYIDLHDRPYFSAGISRRSVGEDEGHFQMNTVFNDFITLDANLLVLNPCAGNVIERFDGPLYTCLDGVLEAIG
jgi:hypothetical protein